MRVGWMLGACWVPGVGAAAAGAAAVAACQLLARVCAVYICLPGQRGRRVRVRPVRMVRLGVGGHRMGGFVRATRQAPKPLSGPNAVSRRAPSAWRSQGPEEPAPGRRGQARSGQASCNTLSTGRVALAISSRPNARSAVRDAPESTAAAPSCARAASHPLSVLRIHCFSSQAASSVRSRRSLRAAIASCKHMRRHWRATSGCEPASSFARSR